MITARRLPLLCFAIALGSPGSTAQPAANGDRPALVRAEAQPVADRADGTRWLYVNQGRVVQLSPDGLKTVGAPKSVYDGCLRIRNVDQDVALHLSTAAPPGPSSPGVPKSPATALFASPCLPPVTARPTSGASPPMDSEHCAGTAGYSQRLLSRGRDAPTAQDDTCAVRDPRGERKDRQYAESIAYSDNGSMEGPWRHETAPILQDDVGHGSVFTAFDGRLLLVIHKYFRQPATRVQIYELEESPNRIRVKCQLLGAP